MKEMTSVATTMMSEEEKADMEREMNEAAGGAPPSSPSPAVSPAPAQPAAPTPTPASPASATGGGAAPSSRVSLVPSPARSPSPSSLASPAPGTPGPEKDHLASASKSPASSSSTNLKERERDAHGRKRSKLTPEQKKKLQELDEERKKNMEERIETLREKLVDRLRPFVEANNPGGKDDPETAAFQRKMKSEADDMKLESFGVELLHTIGNIYITKATSFLKSKKFLGMWVLGVFSLQYLVFAAHIS